MEGKVEAPERCTQCPFYGMDRSLGYYNVLVCKKSKKEISFNGSNGWDRMKWCPLVTEGDK